MKKTSLLKRLSTILHIAFALALIPTLARAQVEVESKTETPKKLTAYWATTDIITLHFDTKRTSNQREDDKNNLRKKGIPQTDVPTTATIKGQEILDFIGPYPALKDGEKVPQELLNQVVALMTLDRVIDYYGKKSGVAFKDTYAYAHYSTLAVLARNAALMKKIATTETEENGKKSIHISPDVDATRLDATQMYAWLKERAGANVVKLKIDWKFTEGGLGKELPRDAAQWPEARFYFEKLPETVHQFTQEINKQLEPVAAKVRRYQIWSSLSSTKMPAHARFVIKDPNYTEIEKLYNAVKDGEIERQKKMGVKEPKFDMNDEQVRSALSDHLKKNQQAYAVRETVHAIFKETIIMRGDFDTSIDPKWPSLQLDAETLTNSLFVETLYPGEKVQGGQFGVAYKNTLGQPNQFFRVMVLNGDVLNVLFQ